MPSTSSARRPSSSPFEFYKHRDYGLLRARPGIPQFDIFHDDGTWQAIIMNPFTASMAPISEVTASALAGGRDLHAPIVAREVSPGVVEPVS